ncbi:MAG: hypothetical protein CMJ33_02080 [Phycisphaerae bacterium]|nr:hypothetical protein [Phycisphaerae bacterium]
MTGPSTHSMMPTETLERDGGQVIERALELLKNRRALIHAPACPSARPAEGIGRRGRFQRAVTQSLQGSLLSVEARRELMSHANELGMRPFEATLMIAMAQDRARHGLAPLETDPLKHEPPESRRRPVPTGRPSRSHMSTAICTGVFLASTLIVLMWL